MQTIQLPSRSAIESILKELKTTAEVKDQDQEETVVVPKLNVLRIDKEKLVIDIQAKVSSIYSYDIVKDNLLLYLDIINNEGLNIINNAIRIAS